MKSYTAIALISLALVSCTKDDDNNSGPTSAQGDPIKLTDLQVGQSSTYERYEDVCGLADVFDLSGDTLHVKVVTENGKLYFEESYTPGSVNFGELDPIRHEVIFHDTFILIPERTNSNLFYFYGNDTIHTQPQPDVNLDQGFCYLQHENGDPFIGEEIGLLSSFHLETINHGENFAISCVPPFMEMDAYLLYDTDGILNLSQTISLISPSPQITGFSLIEN